MIKDELDLIEIIKYSQPFIGDRRRIKFESFKFAESLIKRLQKVGIEINRDSSYYISPEFDISFNAGLTLENFPIQGYKLISGNVDKEGKLEIEVLINKSNILIQDPIPIDNLAEKYTVSALLSYKGAEDILGAHRIAIAKEIIQNFYSSA